MDIAGSSAALSGIMAMHRRRARASCWSPSRGPAGGFHHGGFRLATVPVQKEALHHQGGRVIQGQGGGHGKGERYHGSDGTQVLLGIFPGIVPTALADGVKVFMLVKAGRRSPGPIHKQAASKHAAG